MTPWLKISLILGLIVASFTIGWHEKAIRVDAALKNAAEALAAAEAALSKERNDEATKAETAKGNDDTLTSQLLQKWSTNHDKPLAGCTISPGTLSLLKSSTVRHNVSR